MLLLLLALPPLAVQTAIKDAVGRELVDPYSAQYDWQPIEDPVVYCGWVNAKNQFGAYTGYQPFWSLYSISKSGKATVYDVSLKHQLVTKLCLDRGYRISR